MPLGFADTLLRILEIMVTGWKAHSIQLQKIGQRYRFSFFALPVTF